jgi:hypothetical protein
VIWGRDGRLSALDCMEVPTCEPAIAEDAAGSQRQAGAEGAHELFESSVALVERS